MVNGYVTLDLASKNIYKEALGAIKAGKPVMVVDAPDVYFADTIKTATIEGDVVVQITKGGKTITINDVNAVSSEGDFVNHLYNVAITNGNETLATLLTIKSNNEYDTEYNTHEGDVDAKKVYELIDEIYEIIPSSGDVKLLPVAMYNYDNLSTIFLRKQSNGYDIQMTSGGDDVLLVEIRKNNDTYTINNDTSYVYIDIKKLI